MAFLAGLSPVSSRRPYTGRLRPGHIAKALLLCIGGVIGGCGSLTLARSPEVTNSVPATTTAAAAETLRGDRSDWEAVKTTVAQLAAKPVRDQRLEWANSETGNSGTITDVVAANRNGASCREFSTTRASLDGVRAYRGAVCEGQRGVWELVVVEPADGEPRKPD